MTPIPPYTPDSGTGGGGGGGGDAAPTIVDVQTFRWPISIEELTNDTFGHFLLDVQVALTNNTPDELIIEAIAHAPALAIYANGNVSDSRFTRRFLLTASDGANEITGSGREVGVISTDDGVTANIVEIGGADRHIVSPVSVPPGGFYGVIMQDLLQGGNSDTNAGLEINDYDGDGGAAYVLQIIRSRYTAPPESNSLAPTIDNVLSPGANEITILGNDLAQVHSVTLTGPELTADFTAPYSLAAAANPSPARILWDAGQIDITSPLLGGYTVENVTGYGADGLQKFSINTNVPVAAS